MVSTRAMARNSVRIMQRNIRGYLARRRVHRMRVFQRTYGNIPARFRPRRAATDIQRVIRGRNTRRIVGNVTRWLPADLRTHVDPFYFASTRQWLDGRTRVVLRRRNAATTLQRLHRGGVVRAALRREASVRRANVLNRAIALRQQESPRMARAFRGVRRFQAIVRAQAVRRRLMNQTMSSAHSSEHSYRDNYVDPNPRLGGVQVQMRNDAGGTGRYMGPRNRDNFRFHGYDYNCRQYVRFLARRHGYFQMCLNDIAARRITQQGDGN